MSLALRAEAQASAATELERSRTDRYAPTPGATSAKWPTAPTTLDLARGARRRPRGASHVPRRPRATVLEAAPGFAGPVLVGVDGAPFAAAGLTVHGAVRTRVTRGRFVRVG